MKDEVRVHLEAPADQEWSLVSDGTRISAIDWRPRTAAPTSPKSFELFDTAALRAYWALAGRWRGWTNRAATPERIKAVVEA
jgi:hypothetical protein